MANVLKLHAELQTQLAQYRTKRSFDAESWVAQKAAMFNDYMKRCGLSACTISLSGGVDSAVTMALCMHAKSLANSPIKRVVGVAQPIKSSAWALNRAREAAEALGCEFITVDQTALHTQLQGLVDTALGLHGHDFASGQLRSYMRTPVGYYVAQLLSQAGTPCVVMGTGNMDEDGYLAYFCKAGDGVVDVQLIADLHKSEVFKVGAYLGVPQSTLSAAPSADLWEAQTDEEELGFTYDFIELFTGHYLRLTEAQQAEFVGTLSPDAQTQFDTWAQAARATHRRNSHKLNSPVNLNVLHLPKEA